MGAGRRRNVSAIALWALRFNSSTFWGDYRAALSTAGKNLSPAALVLGRRNHDRGRGVFIAGAARRFSKRCWVHVDWHDVVGDRRDYFIWALGAAGDFCS